MKIMMIMVIKAKQNKTKHTKQKRLTPIQN